MIAQMKNIAHQIGRFLTDHRAALIIAVLGSVAGVVAVVLVFDGRLGGREAQGSQITIEEIVNQVETHRSTEVQGNISRFLPARVGQNLSSGDGVRTFRDSQARVDIRIQEFLRIVRTTPNTTWRLGQFALDEAAIIELNDGKLFLVDDGFRSDVQPVKIVTPVGTASPRGTWMSVEYDSLNGVMEVECFRGVCEVENDLGLQVLTDEQKSTVTEKTPPTEPVFLAPEESSEFKELPEAKKGEIKIPTPQVIPPTITPTPTPTATPTSTPTPTPTSTPTATPTSTPTPTPTATPTSTPRPTATAVPTPTLRPTATAIPTATPLPTATVTPTATPPPTAKIPSTPKPTSTPLFELPKLPTEIPKLPSSCRPSFNRPAASTGVGDALLIAALLAMTGAWRRRRR